MRETSRSTLRPREAPITKPATESEVVSRKISSKLRASIKQLNPSAPKTNPVPRAAQPQRPLLNEVSKLPSAVAGPPSSRGERSTPRSLKGSLSGTTKVAGALSTASVLSAREAPVPQQHPHAAPPRPLAADDEYFTMTPRPETAEAWKNQSPAASPAASAKIRLNSTQQLPSVKEFAEQRASQSLLTGRNLGDTVSVSSLEPDPLTPSKGSDLAEQDDERPEPEFQTANFFVSFRRATFAG